jgi:hypothetical protein
MHSMGKLIVVLLIRVFFHPTKLLGLNPKFNMNVTSGDFVNIKIYWSILLKKFNGGRVCDLYSRMFVSVFVSNVVFLLKTSTVYCR